MRRGYLVTLVFLTALIALSANDLTIKRENSVLRSGPASYHKVLAKLPVNSRVRELNRKDGWIEVMFKTQQGYIAPSSLNAKTLNNDPFAAIASSSANSRVAQHSVTAGVKGFAQYYDSSYGFAADQSFWELATAYETDLDEYSSFYTETYSSSAPMSFMGGWSIPKNPKPDYFSESHEGFGLAVAAVIAKAGLYSNPLMNRYVNYVGQNLVLASDAGDISFRFFILDISQPNAYACPGGYIFITKGMLQTVANEAELAFALAHEIAHVTRFHGMIELKARENQIGAESLFAELDEARPDAFSEDAKAIEAELENDIMQMFESLIQGRLDEYELEADQLALIFMARSGYKPAAASALMSRLYGRGNESNNQHYRLESIATRVTGIDNELRKYRDTGSHFLHSERLQRYKADAGLR